MERPAIRQLMISSDGHVVVVSRLNTPSQLQRINPRTILHPHGTSDPSNTQGVARPTTMPSQAFAPPSAKRNLPMQSSHSTSSDNTSPPQAFIPTPQLLLLIYSCFYPHCNLCHKARLCVCLQPHRVADKLWFFGTVLRQSLRLVFSQGALVQLACPFETAQAMGPLPRPLSVRGPSLPKRQRATYVEHTAMTMSHVSDTPTASTAPNEISLASVSRRTGEQTQRPGQWALATAQMVAIPAWVGSRLCGPGVGRSPPCWYSVTQHRPVFPRPVWCEQQLPRRGNMRRDDEQRCISTFSLMVCNLSSKEQHCLWSKSEPFVGS